MVGEKSLLTGYLGTQVSNPSSYVLNPLNNSRQLVHLRHTKPEPGILTIWCIYLVPAICSLLSSLLINQNLLTSALVYDRFKSLRLS